MFSVMKLLHKFIMHKYRNVNFIIYYIKVTWCLSMFLFGCRLCRNILLTADLTLIYSEAAFRFLNCYTKLQFRGKNVFFYKIQFNFKVNGLPSLPLPLWYHTISFTWLNIASKKLKAQGIELQFEISLCIFIYIYRIVL